MTVRLRQCCCGCSLKEGTIVIAVICLLLSTAAFLSATHYVVQIAMHHEENDRSRYIGPEVILPILILQLLLCMTELVTSSLLLRGVLKYDRRLVIPWLVANAIMCGSLFLAVVGGTVACYIVTANQFKDNLDIIIYGLVFLVVGAIAVGCYVYSLVVVYSFYCLLPMLSPQRIAILLDRFKNPYLHQEDDSDHMTTEDWNVTATHRFSGY